jgi:hypothetical protein
MEDVMTLAEIRRRFFDEWVLIQDPETNQALNVQGGRVVHHSKDRDEVYRQAIALHAPRYAVVYTGVMPKDTAIIL